MWTVAVVAVLALAAWIAYRRTQVSISRYGIVERGFFGGITTIAARDVDGVLRTQLYRANSLETTSELFVVRRAGRGAFRMRGRFWDESSMDLVAETLDVDETVRTEPVTLAELRASDPKLLYWFERRSLGAEAAGSEAAAPSRCRAAASSAVLDGSSWKPSRS